MIENIYPAGWQRTRGLHSPAKKIDMGGAYFIYTSGHQADKNENHEIISTDIEEQTEQVFQSLARTLAAAGATMDDVVKAQIFVTDMAEFPKVSTIRDRWFAVSQPTSSLVALTNATRKNAKIEIALTAVIPKETTES